MEQIDPAERFAALGHPARLAVLRLLVQAGPQGLAAGDIADRLDTRNNLSLIHISEPTDLTTSRMPSSA